MAEALDYGAAIADALDPAHRAGLVHRDVKPLNIILTEAGVKLVDFGLVRSTAPFPGHGEAEAVTTVPADLTAPGMVLGTLHYMAPEQINGTEADARTDIFSFGAVLYEMVTGVKPFSGKNSFSLMASMSLTAKTEPRVGDSRGMKGPDTRQQRHATDRFSGLDRRQSSPSHEVRRTS
jgi:serine/threonine protein kinase